MLDNKGQVSLEYILIFSIVLILLIAFTLPMMETTLDNTFDVYDSLSVKAEVSKVASAINNVYGQGQGARQTILIQIDDPLTLKIYKNYLSTTVYLHDGSSKTINIDYESNIAPKTIKLSEGKNMIVIEWPVDSENLIAYKK